MTKLDWHHQECYIKIRTTRKYLILIIGILTQLSRFPLEFLEVKMRLENIETVNGSNNAKSNLIRGSEPTE